MPLALSPTGPGSPCFRLFLGFQQRSKFLDLGTIERDGVQRQHQLEQAGKMHRLLAEVEVYLRPQQGGSERAFVPIERKRSPHPVAAHEDEGHAVGETYLLVPKLLEKVDRLPGFNSRPKKKPP